MDGTIFQPEPRGDHYVKQYTIELWVNHGCIFLLASHVSYIPLCTPALQANHCLQCSKISMILVIIFYLKRNNSKRKRAKRCMGNQYYINRKWKETNQLPVKLKTNHLICIMSSSGFSISNFHSLQNFATVAPSKTLWSAAIFTWAGQNHIRKKKKKNPTISSFSYQRNYTSFGEKWFKVDQVIPLAIILEHPIMYLMCRILMGKWLGTSLNIEEKINQFLSYIHDWGRI